MYLDKLQPLKVYLGGDPDVLREEAVDANLWRPTAVVLVRYREHYLVSQHRVLRERNGVTVPGIKPDLPKGGVENEDVSVEAAAYRELHEEVCLIRRHVHALTYFGHTLVPFDSDNYKRYAFEKGKIYLLYHATINDKGHVAPGEAHGVTNIEWRRDPANAFVKKGKYTKKGKILNSEEIRSVLRGFRKAA